MSYANLNTADFLQSDKTRIYQEDGIISIDGVPGAVASGTDTYTATITGIEAYAEGQVFLIEFTNANTGSSTININSLGAKTLKKSVSTNLAAADIAAGQCFVLAYDGTNFQVIGLGGSGGLTGSGTTNEIAYFTGASSLASLTTATYPSLTELSYVKGVTSAIQTQLDAITNQLGSSDLGTSL